MSEKEDNLKVLEYFFKVDIYIKDVLYKLVPREEMFFTESSFIEYQNTLFKTIKDIEYSLVNVDKLFNLGLNNILTNYFKNLIEQLLITKNNYSDFKNFYQNFFSNLDTNLVEKVNQTCIGYLLSVPYESLFKECKTINELLHVFHSYIVNNENIYREMPVVENNRSEYYDKTLYGNMNDISETMCLAKDIYVKLLKNDAIGSYTDIVPISDQNKIIAMIRDRGHALTLEIDIEKNNVAVHYFIPKICNLDMVRALPGINSVRESDKTAKGFFLIPKENCAQKISDFVIKVPSDDDMIIPNIKFN